METHTSIGPNNGLEDAILRDLAIAVANGTDPEAHATTQSGLENAFLHHAKGRSRALRRERLDKGLAPDDGAIALHWFRYGVRHGVLAQLDDLPTLPRLIDLNGLTIGSRWYRDHYQAAYIRLCSSEITLVHYSIAPETYHSGLPKNLIQRLVAFARRRSLKRVRLENARPGFAKFLVPFGFESPDEGNFGKLVLKHSCTSFVLELGPRR